MKMYNQTALVLRAKPAYVEWVRKTLQKNKQIKADEKTQILIDNLDLLGASAYILPNFEDTEKRETFVRQHFEDYFENELQRWTTQFEEWPDDITEELFEEWFNIGFHSVLIDLNSLNTKK